jgi:hypothetical protein
MWNITSSLAICHSLFSIYDVLKIALLGAFLKTKSLYSSRLPTRGTRIMYTHGCFRLSYELISLIFAWKSENNQNSEFPSGFDPDTSIIRMRRDLFSTISG